MSTINVRESISKVIENPWRFVNLRSLAIFFGLNQTPISLKDIIAKCNEPGHVHRTAFLEIDMMTGTAFPPDQLLFENRIHTFQDIFLRDGIILDVRVDENNVPDFSDTNGTYSDGELDNLMGAHRNPAFQQSGNKWSAYLVVITQDDGMNRGIMWDTQRRRGCAVCHTVIGTDSLQFFRTSAHEIGHEFNLHHEDVATYSEGGFTKLSIMSPTNDIISSPNGWPNGVGLTFGEHGRTHLSGHPVNNVRPGGSTFNNCNQEHQSWH